MNKEKTDKIFNAITSNGCREMYEERFHQAVNEILGNNVCDKHDLKSEFKLFRYVATCKKCGQKFE